MSASANYVRPNAESWRKKLFLGRRGSILLLMPLQKDKLPTLPLQHQELFMGYPIEPGAFYRLFPRMLRGVQPTIRLQSLILGGTARLRLNDEDFHLSDCWPRLRSGAKPFRTLRWSHTSLLLFVGMRERKHFIRRRIIHLTTFRRCSAPSGDRPRKAISFRH